ncbi:type II toxin-antitoxin system VapC family toxin [Acaryochloris sp. CCMEE 5410]|uniref:type II toxin-antitoxin system VapC family toxin n=1 Tax=Acaryochloris sp. CCMEE 5410 TaxID=310037 RepID=UPI00024846DE|nr:PIN domain-containing protein [Acaryochloris sp. CCMEE 5410]KAI9130975.1 PIN domain-containing protein [Acaryochloris sp. CCMEE 5410]
MNGILIDSCVLLDLFTDDPNWAEWSESILERYSLTNTLYINSIVYTEISMGFEKIEELESAIEVLHLKVLEMPREALFLTGKVFLQYRKNKGTKTSPLPDFFIGAHASVSEFDLITRDVSKYKTYFPQVALIYP